MPPLEAPKPIYEREQDTGADGAVLGLVRNPARCLVANMRALRAYYQHRRLAILMAQKTLMTGILYLLALGGAWAYADAYREKRIMIIMLT